MLPLDYSKKRLLCFLNEIDRLLEIEFPYSHSREALKKIQRYFQGENDKLCSFTSPYDVDLVNHLCTIVLGKLYIYLPILGFILRSTNVRNSFEVFGPALRLAGDLLEPDIDLKERKTNLLISSEWDFSPYVYRELPELPGFALIGLPAPESSNPLLIPLFGHELGHLIWSKERLRDSTKPEIVKHVISNITSDWSEYVRIFPHQGIKPEEVENNIFAMQYWGNARDWALKQAEETFSDLMALRIFGKSFLLAFAYLISPNLSIQRSVNYPDIVNRARNLIKGARAFSVTLPDEYELLFTESNKPNMTDADQFRLMIADQALLKTVDTLIGKVNEIKSRSKIKEMSTAEENRIYKRFEQVVPAENCKTISDILNAAWRAFVDPSLWNDIPQIKDRRDEILKEIVLKNIGVFEIEQRVG